MITDQRFGILCYGTRFKGIGGAIKQRPEDFVVAEVLKHESRRLIDRGEYPLFVLCKKGADTLEAKAIFERQTGLSVNILGLKDRNAMTYQFLSSRRKLLAERRVEGKNFSALLVARTLRPLTKADLLGNSFKVTIRNAEIKVDILEVLKKELEEGRIPNFYGPQRFGERLSNHVIGRLIVKREFDEAAKLIFGDRLPNDDSIASLRSIPIQLRRLYVSSYQSYLFNLCLSEMIKDETINERRGLFISYHKRRIIVDQTIRSEALNDTEIAYARLGPLPGYSFREREDSAFQKMKYILEQEGITPSQFYIKEMQEVSAEGGLRPLSMVGWLRGWQVEDELLLRFVLLTGSYATILLRELMKATIQN